MTLNEDPRWVRNAADPEYEAVRFYPAMSEWLLMRSDPHTWLAQYGIRREESRVPEQSADEFYDMLLNGSLKDRNSDFAKKFTAKCLIELEWHRCLQPEYKVWPAAVCALAATDMDIDCSHFRLPFPAIALRFPDGFLKEHGSAVIESVLCSIRVDDEPGWSRATTSISGGRALLIIIVNLSERFMGPHGRPWMNNEAMVYTLELTNGRTLADCMNSHLKYEPYEIRPGVYAPSPKLVLELFSIVIGTSFLATSRLRRERPMVSPDKRHRPERRRFEREHDGQEQPTFSVGRNLILPRASGVPSPSEAGEEGPGEGTGRELKFAHFRSGHMRYQPHGSRSSPEYDLIFIEPMMIRPDLPVRLRSTPADVEDIDGTFDVTERQPN